MKSLFAVTLLQSVPPVQVRRLKSY